MGLSNIYIETIAHLEPTLQESLIRESPHCRVDTDEIPFLRGASIVDFGFENLPNGRELVKAFVSGGLLIPGTHERLVYDYLIAKVEPADGDEVKLPDNWAQAVLALGPDNKPSWVGKMVRPDQTGKIDLSDYMEWPDGWSL